MAKKQNFEILAKMAAQNKNIRMSTILVSANKNGKNGHITMGIEGNSVTEIAMDPDKYIPILFLVDKKEYFELAEQESELEQIKAKAAAYDSIKAKENESILQKTEKVRVPEVKNAKFGIVVFYETNHTTKTIAEIQRTAIIPIEYALSIYCETPNPASQIIKFSTEEEMSALLQQLEEDIKDPEWLENLFECI